MFVGRYRFRGSVPELVAGHERLLASLPPDQITLHLCLTDAEGITVLDACPSRDVFERFSTSRTFADAVAAAGLPAFEAEPLGDLESWTFPDPTGP
jgi:hypothetical protein